MSGPVYDDPWVGHHCPWCNGTMWFNGKTWVCPNGCHDVTPRTPEPVCERCGSHINPDYGTGPVCGACLKEKEDAVISPSHYTAGGIETIDFIRAKLTPDEFRGFLKGSIIKYLSRANLKGSEEQDYAKASFYSRMLAGDDPRGEAE